MRPKKIDIFILKSFLLLLAGTFFICLFLLLMNVLWRYIDVMVGKGLSFGVLTEFFLCSALTLVPMALPLAVLLASLITFGNFGERYELIAMKTSGISLLRVMRPLTLLCVLLALISFYFQNVVAPYASKRVDTLAYSMVRKSPELEIPEGSFYDAITGYNLYVRHKDTNTGVLYGVTIYDVSKGFEEIRVIAADSGRMETTSDQQHLYLHLYDGEQFENMEAQNMRSSNNPYRRETFKEKHLLIEFNSDFDLVDDRMISTHASTKNMVKIRHDIDSISLQQDSLGIGNLFDYKMLALANTYSITKTDSDKLQESDLRYLNVDSVYQMASRADQLRYRENMQSRIKTQVSELSFKNSSMESGDRNIRMHWIEWMKKLSLCVSVLIFFYIGAPLGAIIRKGGLGVPVIVSVCTFILYYMTSVSGEKMYREGDWGMLGCWLSTMVLLPLSVFFTVMANKDSTVFELDVYKEFFRHWFGGRVRRNIIVKDVVIDDPDLVGCIGLNDEIVGLTDAVAGNCRLGKMPAYKPLFFGDGEFHQLNELYEKTEKLVEELSNSRDKIVLELINGFPVMPVYGVEPPFRNDKVNAVIGLVFPIGLLFWGRAWLFSSKLYRQMDKTRQIGCQLSSYLKTGKLSVES